MPAKESLDGLKSRFVRLNWKSERQLGCETQIII